jgi:hypothetical protein
MSDRTTLGSLGRLFDQRIHEYEQKCGGGLSDSNQYWQYVGRIRELKDLKNELDKLKKREGYDEDSDD